MEQPTGDIELVIRPRARDLGEFTVRRSLPDARRQRVGPFIFFDHMGPVDFPPGMGVNVRPHPHIGLATITYLFDGEIMHRDSLGYRQSIRPGAVNWMTAGRGIVHSERSPEGLRVHGSYLHGIQSWVALPEEFEVCEPSFQHYPADEIPRSDVDGTNVRVIIGEAFGLASPVKTLSRTIYAELDLPQHGSIGVPGKYEEMAVYVVSGKVEAGETTLDEGSLAVMRPGGTPRMRAASDAKVMLLGGDTLPGERIIWWNFVNSSPARLEQAKLDWKDQRFDKVPDETDFIPLPET